MGDVEREGHNSGLTKLIGVITDSFGTFSDSFLGKKNPDQKKSFLEAMTRLEISTGKSEQYDLAGGRFTDERTDVQNNINNPLEDVALRAERRQFYQRVVGQQNLENITSVASEQLSEETDVSDEPVDSDWLNRFFQHAEGISSEEMQYVWGRILAGEIKKPNTYSYRTLEVIRLLTKADADEFTKLCSRSLTSLVDDIHFFPYTDKADDIKLPALYRLREAGLLLESDFASINFKAKTSAQMVVMYGFQHVLKVESPVGNNEFILKIRPFTVVGKELSKLVSPVDDFDAMISLATKIRNAGNIVEFGPIRTRDEFGIPDTFKKMEEW
ncbi:hypothetical protein DYBT9623_04451 [Dyadobacter sp. CECT 9623]|uniref:DUF2806 domain-containing protein n=1 Tax=Dyadobacter linearis TaxID=2823330 RepID=A0ABM8UWP3_9BACT|nr:DUF2806 domain-containing protein [Dyadobacter sp. CECT 9623]CAG5072914.1 hypothetical protein DYBT9623_04451 [Dyadobacter sp. CECT 9623]